MCKQKAECICLTWSPSVSCLEKYKQEASCKCLAWSPSISCLSYKCSGSLSNEQANECTRELTLKKFFFPFIFISWRLITLQYCSGFCHTLTWISHGFTCVPHPDPLSRIPPDPIPLGLPRTPALSTWLFRILVELWNLAASGQAPLLCDVLSCLTVLPFFSLFLTSSSSFCLFTTDFTWPLLQF